MLRHDLNIQRFACCVSVLQKWYTKDRVSDLHSYIRLHIQHCLKEHRLLPVFGLHKFPKILPEGSLRHNTATPNECYTLAADRILRLRYPEAHTIGLSLQGKTVKQILATF